MIVRTLAGSLALLATLGLGAALAPSASATEVKPVTFVAQPSDDDGDDSWVDDLIDSVIGGDEWPPDLPGLNAVTDYIDEELEWETMTPEERAAFEVESEADERFIQDLRERWDDEES
jgi:hypothetical protein